MRTGIRILRNFLYIYVIYNIWANIAIVDYLFDIGYRIRSTAVGKPGLHVRIVLHEALLFLRGRRLAGGPLARYS